jgi:hypothetical protein
LGLRPNLGIKGALQKAFKRLQSEKLESLNKIVVQGD